MFVKTVRKNKQEKKKKTVRYLSIRRARFQGIIPHVVWQLLSLMSYNLYNVSQEKCP